MNTINKLISISILTLLVASPSYAKWTFSDQVNLATSTLNSTKQQLAQQLQKSNDGFYLAIPYRSNDVFVFCKEGPNNQGMNYYWVPTDGVGGYRITNYKKYMYNPESWRSTAYYLTVCPHGKQAGNWTGPGSGGQWKGNTGNSSGSLK